MMKTFWKIIFLLWAMTICLGEEKVGPSFSAEVAVESMAQGNHTFMCCHNNIPYR